ncbi:hypothetical protein KEM55_006325 [Ascosphaera atra]|nr:hypothetical protein KEM55_006325 [Ascosphaera atra]
MVEAAQTEDTPMMDDAEVQAKTEDTEKVPDIKDDPEQGARRESSDGGVKDEGDKEDEVHGVPLEELFADDVDDMGIDQFPNGDSQATNGSQLNGKAEESPAPSAAPQVTSEMMFAFYQRLFPFNTLFQWLNHGVKSSPDFGNREFAFTLQNDAYLRYQSFLTADR